MLKSLTIAILTLASYFGLIFFIESTVPEVKSLTAHPVKSEASTEPAISLPEQVLGSFLFDQAATQQWRQFQTFQFPKREYTLLGNLPGHSVLLVANEVRTQLGNFEQIIPVEVKSTGENQAIISVLHPDLNEMIELIIKWDSQGFWVSTYLLPESGERKRLSRERFRKIPKKP